MTDPKFGDGYPGDKNKPSALRFIAAINPDGELEDITDGTDVWVDRLSVRISRQNTPGSSANMAFDLIYENAAGPEMFPNRYIAVDDPDTITDDGGYLGYFAGYIADPEAQEEALERVIKTQCTDYGTLGQTPPKQITTQWPPGEGTPVVDTTVDTSLTHGSAVMFAPKSVRHLYGGKKVFAQNSDGSNRERITIITADPLTGQVTADFATDKVSTTTTVAGALHATGLQTVTPASMANINLGSILYCKKHHGVQTVGNEFVLVTAVTLTTFTAYFTAWKTHDWEVQSYWSLEGGITDKELIADGWFQTIDLVDDGTGLIASELIAVESLLDLCYNNVGFSMNKSLVQELNLSLPHGKWVGSTPDDVLTWVLQQNEDPAVSPQYYFTFIQATVTGLVTLVPAVRYYDANASTWMAPITLTNDVGLLDYDTQARYAEYTYREDGRNFRNKLTVLGANDSAGSWVDQASISDPLADNYVGRVIEARPVQDNTCTTNAQCDARAAELASIQQLSKRRRTVDVTTFAQLAPRVIYEPHVVNFSATFEPGLPADLVVNSVELSFDDNGMAVYHFVLGDPVPLRARTLQDPRKFRRGTVYTGPTGKVTTAAPSSTKYLTTHTLLADDADIYVADTSDGPINVYLPAVNQYPGLPITIKVPADAPDNATVYAFNRGGREDTVDGAASMVVKPGQSIMIQSAGEHDRTGLGGRWEQTGNLPGGDPWLTNGNTAVGDTIFGLNSGSGRILLNIGDHDGAGAFNFGEVDPGNYPAMYLYTYLDVRMDTPQNAGQPSDEADTAIFGRSHVHGPTAGSGSPTGIEGDAFIGYDAGHATGGFIAGLLGVTGIDSGKGAEVDLLNGVLGIVSHQGTNTLHKAAGIVAKTVAAPSGGGTIEKIYGVWGQAQSQGTLENWSGYFEGNIWTTGDYLPERSAPPTPAADTLAIYAKDKAGVSNLYFKDDAGVEHDLGASGGAGITNPYDIQANTMVWERTDHVALMDFHYGPNFRGDTSMVVDVSRGHSHSTTGSNYTTFQSANASLELRDDVSVSADLSGIFIKANVEIMPKTPEHASGLNNNVALLVRTGEDSGAFTGSLFRVYNEDDGIQVLDVYPNGDSVFNTNLGTTSTRGDIYIPAVNGTPTGTPAGHAGTVPMRYDKTNHILYAYEGGSWRAV